MSRKITILTDCMTREDEARGKLFSGSQGYILKGLLDQVGIEMSECQMLAVFPFVPPGQGIESICVRDRKQAISGYPYIKQGHYIPASYSEHLTRLRQRIEANRPNVIVALGNLALWAMCKQTGIERARGAPTYDHTGEFKVIPTWHPSAVNKQWNLRPIMFMDLAKAKRESEYPQLKRPSRYLHIEPSLTDIEDFYQKYIVPAPFIGADIETKSGTITEIGFASSSSRAINIPFWSRSRVNYWKTAKEEREAWEWVRRILAEKYTVWQNGQYDMQYLWRTMGIPTPRFFGDTMILHHSLQPEMKKGLGFMASIYTDEPSWKFMRTDHSTMKREDE